MNDINILEFQLEMEEMRHNLYLGSILQESTKLNFIFDKIKQFLINILNFTKKVKNEIIYKLNFKIKLKFDLYTIRNILDDYRRTLKLKFMFSQSSSVYDEHVEFAEKLDGIKNNFNNILDKETTEREYRPDDIKIIYKEIEDIVKTLKDINEYIFKLSKTDTAIYKTDRKLVYQASQEDMIRLVNRMQTTTNSMYNILIALTKEISRKSKISYIQ